MKQFEIDMSKEKEITGCKTCGDGSKIEGPFVRTQKYADKFETVICGACNSKFKTKRTDADKLIEERCLNCPFLEKETCTNEVKDYLCYGNLERFKKEMEEKTMDLDLIHDKDIFEKTGKCPKHHWIMSSPVITSEGRFIFTSCGICMFSKVTYKGQEYHDSLINLINFIVDNGIENEKKMSEQKKGLELVKELPKGVDLDSVFKKEVPDLGFVKKVPDLGFEKSVPDFGFL